jgi:hypothetical protein
LANAKRQLIRGKYLVSRPTVHNPGDTSTNAHFSNGWCNRRKFVYNVSVDNVTRCPEHPSSNLIAAGLYQHLS